MVSVEYSEAIVEVLDILKHTDDDVVEKIPKKLIEFWERNKSDTYKSDIDHSKPLNEIKLREKTKSIITMIYINYLCNQEEKDKIKIIINKNEESYQRELREKYNPNDIFKNKMEKSQSLVEYKKKSFIQKIINKIKNIFKRRHT